MVKFLNGCHSVFHAVALMEKQLQEEGFTELFENEDWSVESNHCYYVKRNNTSIIAFKVPEKEQIRSINIVASHSDSPTFKIKPVITADLTLKFMAVPFYRYGWTDRYLQQAG